MSAITPEGNKVLLSIESMEDSIVVTIEAAADDKLFRVEELSIDLRLVDKGIADHFSSLTQGQGNEENEEEQEPNEDENIEDPSLNTEN